MMQLDQLGPNEPHGLYAVEIAVKIGRHASVDARATNAGLLSVGILVSGILLSTAVIVNAARRRVTTESGASGDGC